MSLIGDNNPPAPADLFGRRVQALNDELASYLTGEITEPIAAALRDPAGFKQSSLNLLRMDRYRPRFDFPDENPQGSA